jgi:hypothetical protein
MRHACVCFRKEAHASILPRASKGQYSINSLKEISWLFLNNAGQALLSNGHVLANMRTSNTRHTCSCRAVRVSTNGGESFGAVGLSLGRPVHTSNIRYIHPLSVFECQNETKMLTTKHYLTHSLRLPLSTTYC